jgi:ABC-2 type transport system permease protein
VLANIMFGVLLIFTGANVPVDQLPGWMQTISDVLPFTHGIDAARQVVNGASLSDVSGLLTAEVALGVVYGAFGYLFIGNAERLSLRYATLDHA